MTFGRPVEQTEPGVSIFSHYLLPWRNHTNHFTGRYPIDFVTWMDVIFFGDYPGDGNLIFGCDFGHIFPGEPLLTLARKDSLLREDQTVRHRIRAWHLPYEAGVKVCGDRPGCLPCRRPKASPNTQAFRCRRY